MSIDKKILFEFVEESKRLVQNLVQILEEIEGDSSQAKRLESYGNQVDRIMGGASSLALLAGNDSALHLIAEYAAVCKAVAYKSSRIKNQSDLYDTCIALLVDATEIIKTLIDSIDLPASKLKTSIPDTFLERLRSIKQQFGEDDKASSTSSKMSQAEIDKLMKKIGQN